MAWLGTWAKRVGLRVDYTKVSAALVDFPVMLDISTTSGQANRDMSVVFDDLAANSLKIAVTTDDGQTQCYVEIELWDNANEKAILHVKVPSVSNSAYTTLYFYWDPAQADNSTYVGVVNSTPAEAVWDSSFHAVYHMAQDPNGDVADSVKDSTANHNHLDPAGTMTTADLINGKVGKAIDLDGSNDTLTAADHASLDFGTDSFTVECLFTYGANHPSDERGLITKASTYFNTAGWVLETSANQMRISAWITNRNPYDGSQTIFLADLVGEAWYHAVFKRVSTTISLYVNGVLAQSKTNASNDDDVSSAQNLVIGDHSWSSNSAANIDEVRLSQADRSAAWIAATYYSLWDNLILFLGLETPATEGGGAVAPSGVTPATVNTRGITGDSGRGDGSGTSNLIDRDFGIQPYYDQDENDDGSENKGYTEFMRSSIWFNELQKQLVKQSELVRPYMHNSYPEAEYYYPTPRTFDLPPNSEEDGFGQYGGWNFCRVTCIAPLYCSDPVKCRVGVIGTPVLIIDGVPTILGFEALVQASNIEFFESLEGLEPRDAISTDRIDYDERQVFPWEISAPSAGWPYWPDDPSAKLKMTMIDPSGNYCQTVLTVFCQQETGGCCDTPETYIPPSISAADTIAPGGSITITAVTGCPPFTFTVSGTGYTITPISDTTATLTSASGTCGINYARNAVVTATDLCGSAPTKAVRSTGGAWELCYSGSTGACEAVLCACSTTLSGTDVFRDQQDTPGSLGPLPVWWTNLVYRGGCLSTCDGVPAYQRSTFALGPCGKDTLYATEAGIPDDATHCWKSFTEYVWTCGDEF